MLELDSPEWAKLTHAFGIASVPTSAPSMWTAAEGLSGWSDVPDTPSLLRELERNPNVDSADSEAEPWYSLWSSLCHQGDIYTASYAAVPHIVRIASTAERTPNWQYFGLPLAVEIARSKGRGPEIPESLRRDYFDAIADLQAVATRISDQPWNDLLTRCILAAIALAQGHVSLADTILELDPGTIDQFRAFQDG